MSSLIRRIWHDDSAQDVVEYALVAALVSVIALASIQVVGTQVVGIWSGVSTTVTQAN